MKITIRGQYVKNIKQVYALMTTTNLNFSTWQELCIEQHI
jgi:hypothetical protein